MKKRPPQHQQPGLSGQQVLLSKAASELLRHGFGQRVERHYKLLRVHPAFDKEGWYCLVVHLGGRGLPWCIGEALLRFPVYWHPVSERWHLDLDRYNKDKHT